MNEMNRSLWLAWVGFVLVSVGLAQDSSTSQNSSSQGSSRQSSSSRNAERDREAGDSSSRDTRIDISPPKDDAKSHPDSRAAVADLEVANKSDAADDVQEVHPWNPMKAMKDLEVGDYYYKQKNYKAALDRYQEALYYKDKDAVASFRVAECYEKLGQKDDARKFYEQYLKILPDGPSAKDAHAALARLEKNP